MRVALRTRLHADRIAEYEQAHREVPKELTDAIRSAGATEWTIWRSGSELFHVLDVEDYAALIAGLERLPANTAWQARMAGLLEEAHDYSSGGADAPLPVVWRLPL